MQGYKGWKGRQRLYSKTRNEGWEWLDECSPKGCIKKIRANFNWMWFLLGVFFILLSYAEVSLANTNKYSFPYADKITMETVSKGHIGGGTYVCPTIQTCYIKVLKAEARGAHLYYDSITIYKDGEILWTRDYRFLRWAEEVAE